MTQLNTKMAILTGVLLASSGCAMNTANVYPGDLPCYSILHDAEIQPGYDNYSYCVRTHWTMDRNTCDVCALRTPIQWEKMRPTTGLSLEERTVYFAFNRSTLTPEAKERLSTLARTLRSNESIKEAKIVGYADRIGSDSYNEKLSQKRAETVRDYLIANGYTNARVTETRWVGESEPSTNCPAEVRPQLIACLQNDRRVEVEIEYLHEGRRHDAR